MTRNKERHTLTLDPDIVRRADRLRSGRSLSSFVNDAVVSYTAELERAIYESFPLTQDEQGWTKGAASRFTGDDDEDWDALFPVIK